MPRDTPPSRADHVGCILRSAAIDKARACRQKAIAAAQLADIEIPSPKRYQYRSSSCVVLPGKLGHDSIRCRKR
jgi:hypothetical protein